MAQVKTSTSPPEHVALNYSYDLVTNHRLTIDFMPGDACSPQAVICACYTACWIPRPCQSCKVKSRFTSDSKHHKLCGWPVPFPILAAWKLSLNLDPSMLLQVKNANGRCDWSVISHLNATNILHDSSEGHLAPDSGPEKPTYGIDWVVSNPVEIRVKQ